jgi:hypothetical protein
MPDPNNAEEKAANCAEYTLAGFPLCLASTDVVHVRQWLISSNLKQLATGNIDGTIEESWKRLGIFMIRNVGIPP